ncbi:MAG: ankyrin repeat domain-containing protein [Prevotellaceae bacterium]|nr:ankyrin repeat domain-containing protein [Prevotellaceae bacterium]
MKYKLIFFFFLSLSLFGCDREKIVDKSRLTGFDYRLFQLTPAWELAKAVQDGNVSKIRELVRKNPELINYQDSIYGNTLLMLTIMNNQFKPFKILIEEGADVNIHDTFSGSSAIIDACEYGNVLYIEVLLSHGADVNDVEVGDRRPGNGTRFTPLMVAASNNFRMVKYLISKGADINYQNEYHQSALSESVLTDNYDIAYYLLQHGADYSRPMFYRPDYSSPEELRDSTDKGKPIYLKDYLLQPHSDIVSKRKINKILEFLAQKELNKR